MPLTPPQLAAIQTTERVMSCFSILGSVFVISTFLASSAFHKPINRLVFCASWGNLATNVGTLIALSGVEAGADSSLCQLQAFLFQMFMPADSLWTLAMAINVYLTLFHRFTPAELRQQEWKYLLLCYGIPFIPALVFVFVETQARGKIFGAATLWCWITIEWNVLRIAVFYGPVWLVLATTACIYAVVGRVVYQNHLHRRAATSSDLSSPSLSAPDSHRQQKPNAVHVPDVRRPKPEATQITFPHDQTVTATQSPEDPAAAHHIASVSSGAAHRAERRNSSTDRAAWAYMRIALLFFAALLVTWVPSTINRVYGLAAGSDPSFPLNFIEALVLPLQGFWNAVIYLSTSIPACRALWAQMVGRRGRARGCHCVV